MDFLLVGIGGALGSLVRFLLGRVISEKLKTTFPIATFFINISGAFLLGLISNINVGSNAYLLMADGFLGAYTTFSTFMYEGFSLFKENKIMNAVSYIFLSIIIGIIGFFLGFQLGRYI